jgi:hypothetical protein
METASFFGKSVNFTALNSVAAQKQRISNSHMLNTRNLSLLMLPRITARSARLKTSTISSGRCLNLLAKLSFRLNYLCPQFDSLHALKLDTHYSNVKIQFLPLRERISPQLERSTTYCYTCIGQCVHSVNHTKDIKQCDKM